MRVLHLVHQYLPDHIGGTELYTQWITETLHHRNYEVSIFFRHSALDQGLSQHTQNGVQTWSAWDGEFTPTRRFLSTFTQPKLLHAFKQVVDDFTPDLVHIQHLMGLPVAMVDVLVQRNIPFVITLHDFWWICANAQLLTNYSQQLCNGPQSTYVNCARCALARANHPYAWPALPPLGALLAWRNRQLRQALTAAQTIIAPAHFVANWYEAHGVHRQQIRVMPHGLNLPTPLPPAQTRGDGLRLAYIGGLSAAKGVHILVEALQGVTANIELWIAGDETAEPAYVANLRVQASPAVKFLGTLSRPEVLQTLVQVDAVVVPAIWYEGFSFLVSESFAMNVPVIASRLGTLEERVEDGVDGLLFTPGDVQSLQNTLLRLIQEPELLPRLKAGIKPMRTLEDYVDELETVYHNAVTANRQKR